MEGPFWYTPQLELTTLFWILFIHLFFIYKRESSIGRTQSHFDPVIV